MKRRLAVLAVTVAAAAAAGCLEKTTLHTLYLSPGGEVTWLVTERDVRSAEQEPHARFAEEQAYLVAAKDGSHPMARALKALGPDGTVKTTVLRAEPPFTVATEASYDSIERVMQQLFQQNGIGALVRLTTDGSRATLRIEFDDSRIDAAPGENPAAVLLEELDTWRIVLTEGGFVEADGFGFDGREAKISAAWLSNAERTGPPTMTLTWKLKAES